jgi:hypothetical protein
VGLVKGALVAITAGPHKDLYGRILSIGGLEKRMRAQLKLTLNGEEVLNPLTLTWPEPQPQLQPQH